MNTPQTSHKLALILEQQGWNQIDLAERSNVHRATIGTHLNNTRAIRDEHLYAYLRAIPVRDASALFAAWLHDLFSTGDDIDCTVLAEILEDHTGRLREDVVDWAPELSPKQKANVGFWIRNLPVDTELDQLFDIITRRSGGAATE